MKKSKKIGLSLNKKVVSSFEQQTLKGGTSGIHTYACGTSTCGQTGLSCNPWMCKYK